MHRHRESRNPPYDPDEPDWTLSRQGQWIRRDAKTTTRERISSSNTASSGSPSTRLDFSERCEQAALRLGFVGGPLGEEELEDLVNLAVNGEILDPASALGEHVNDCWPELVGPAERSLVHWLRRLVFRGAWLDQRVKEGELGVSFDEHPGGFAYVQPTDPGSARASRSSSRPSPPGAGSPTAASAAAARRSPRAPRRAPA